MSLAVKDRQDDPAIAIITRSSLKSLKVYKSLPRHVGLSIILKVLQISDNHDTLYIDFNNTIVEIS